MNKFKTIQKFFEKSKEFNNFIEYCEITEKHINKLEYREIINYLLYRAYKSNFLVNSIENYERAMQYLLEEDPSLTRSLDIAKAIKLDLDDIDSAVLATLIASEKREERFKNLIEDLKKVLK